MPVVKQIARGAFQLLKGLVFVVTTLTLWFLFGVATLKAGTAVFFNPISTDGSGASGTTPTDPGWLDRMRAAVFDFLDLPASGELGWFIGYAISHSSAYRPP